MFSNGYWTIVRVRGVPIRVHWSVPIGAVVLTGFAFVPGAWAGYLLLIVAHELGHAAFVRRLGHRPVAVRVHALGGDCSYASDPTHGDVAAIAWGGVSAQALVWVAAHLVLALAGPPTSRVVADFAHAVTSTNVGLAMLNLLPILPLDGYWAWRLPGIWWAARREQREYFAQRKARAQASEVRPKAIIDVDADPMSADADALKNEVLPPMPVEVEATLARILDEVRLEQRAKRKAGEPERPNGTRGAGGANGAR